MKNFLKNGLLLTLYLQLFALLSHVVIPIASMGTRLFLKNETISNLLCGGVLLIIELLSIFILFRNSKIDEKNSSLKDTLLPLALAFPIQLFLGIVFQFFPYSAGAAVATFGQVWGAQIGAEAHTEVPYYCFIVVFVVKILLMLALAVLGFTFGKKKLAKERADILGSREIGNKK